MGKTYKDNERLKDANKKELKKKSRELKKLRTNEEKKVTTD